MKKYIAQLQQTLKHTFKLSKPRIECLQQIICGVIKNRTVNMTKVANSFVSKAKTTSNYRKIQRFFKQEKLDSEQLPQWLIKQFFADESKLYLCMDRTNWKLGKTDINILMLAVVYEGIAIPILWEMLPHFGSSSSEVRIKLMEKFIKIFGENRIEAILGDREFIGEKWLTFLDENKIPFVIRVKSNQKAFDKKGNDLPLNFLFRNTKHHKIMKLSNTVKISGVNVFTHGTRDKNNDFLILISNSHKIKNLVPTYGKRWEIENLFQSLKGRGFNFEDTHMTNLSKISSLISILSICIVWSHKVGEYKDSKISKVKRKSHGRLQNSYFRYGLDMIINAYHNKSSYPKNFRLCLKIFSKTISELGL